MSRCISKLLVDVSKGAAATPVSLGIPLLPDDLKLGKSLRLKSPAGDCPMTIRPMDVQPMGPSNAQWNLLSFLATGPGTYSLEADDSRPDPVSNLEHPVTLSQSDGSITLDNGRLAITLVTHDKTKGPVTRISLDGKDIVASPESIQFQVEDASSLHGQISKAEILENTPLHAHVRLHGDHRTGGGHIKLTYWLDVHLWANSTSLRLDYQFFNLHKGQEKIQIDAIRALFRPTLGKQPATHLLQQYQTHRMKPRMVTNPAKVEINADWSRSIPYFTSHDMLLDDFDYPFYLKEQTKNTSPWLGLTGESGAVYLHLSDMVQMRPSRLMAEPQQSQLTADLWPGEAGPLTLYQGKTRRRTMTLAFFDESNKPEHQGAINAALMQPLYEGRATASPEHMRAAAVFDVERTLPPTSHMRMEQLLTDHLGAIKLPPGLMNYGDAVESGYTRGYSLAAKQPLLPGVTDDIHPMRPDHPGAVDPLSFKANRFEPTWANNEYDIIHALSIELMRTGQRKHWATLKALARHNIEVDFIYYNDDQWQHHGSPAHAALHVNASAYPSHLWTQGLIEYYCLTGDKDALDVAIMLGDTIIRNLEHPQRSLDFWGFNREIGWALLSLVQLAEATRLERFVQHSKKTVDFLVNYDREAQATPVNLSSVDPLDDIHSQIAGAFFGYASMIEAIDRYARLYPDEKIDQWLETILVKVRDAAINMLYRGRDLDGLRRMIPHGMAIGYERTGEKKFLTLGMLILEIHLNTLLAIDPSGELKYTAMVHRSLVRFLKYAKEDGILDKLEYEFAKELAPKA